MRIPTGLAIAVTAILTLAGCSATVALDPAADAVNPKCADVVVNLPTTVADLPARETNAQGTGAWGSPAGVLLRCGVAVPDPTSTLQCYTVDGIDWLVDPTDAPNYVYTTYGRDPAISVVIDSNTVQDLAALTDLGSAVGRITATHGCIDPQDTTK